MPPPYLSIDGDAMKKKLFSAFVLDIFFWSYSFLVLYKVIFQKLISGQRYPPFYWSEPLCALALGTLVSGCLLSTNMSLGRALKGLAKNSDESIPHTRRTYAFFGYFLIALTFIAGTYFSETSFYEFFSPGGLAGAKRIFLALLDPNLAIFEDALFAAIETIYMAFMATSLALPFAFVLGFFGARNLMDGSRLFFSLYCATRFVLNITRSIEPLVWAIIFSVWVGIGPFAGMLALCFHTVASLAKLYSEQIENIGEGPIEAMKSVGAHPVQVVWYGVVPQVVLPYLSFTIYRWDINVRMATIIGLVGGGGIGTLLMQYQGLAKWNEVGLLVMVIASIVWLMDWVSSRIRAAIK